MPANLFQYAVIVDPDVDPDSGREIGKAELAVEPQTLLADDVNQAQIIAARAIPDEHLDHLDRVRVVVRPF